MWFIVVKVIGALNLRWHHVAETNNILMTEVFQQLNLSENSFGIEFVIESSWNHLDRNIPISITNPKQTL